MSNHYEDEYSEAWFLNHVIVLTDINGMRWLLPAFLFTEVMTKEELDAHTDLDPEGKPILSPEQCYKLLPRIPATDLVSYIKAHPVQFTAAVATLINTLPSKTQYGSTAGVSIAKRGEYTLTFTQGVE